MSNNTHTSNRQDLHPATSEQIEAKVIARQIDYVFEPNLSIDAVRDVEGNQVRVGEHRAPKDMVERYAEQMKRGAVFPAIVVNERHEMIDGNTRRAAAAKNRHTAIAAYVCSGMTALEARSLSIELNQSHGLRMTDEELRRFVSGSVQENHELDVKSYARMTGAKATTISRWIAAEKFHIRASQAGISGASIAALSEAVRVALQGVRLAAVFHSATELAVAGRLPASQVKAVVARANSASSERDALAIVEAELGTHTSRSRTEGSSAIRRSAGSPLHLGGLLRFDVDDLLDVAPEKQHDAFIGLRMVRDLLGDVIEKASAQWELPHTSAKSSKPLSKVA